MLTVQVIPFSTFLLLLVHAVPRLLAGGAPGAVVCSGGGCRIQTPQSSAGIYKLPLGGVKETNVGKRFSSSPA